MPSERVRRRIDALLDEADEALSKRDWRAARELADAALGFDPDNEEAKGFLRAAERAMGGSPSGVPESTESPPGPHSEAHEERDSSQERSPSHFDGLSAGSQPTPGGTGGATSDSVPSSFANGRYTVSRFLGEGGKKRVYLAHDTLLDREVAFALIKTEGFDETSRSRITREAQAMGRLGTHPNIVTVFDLGVEGTEPYMVTELMAGGDVEGLLTSTSVGAGSGQPKGGYESAPTRTEEGGDHPEALEGRSPTTLSLDQTIEIAKAVCEGLQFAHERDIVHRDLKPGNVWLTSDPSTGSGQAQTAKIGDFGLAVMTDRSRLTREGMMVGTVSYMPPEQATGGEITPKADLYSLGAMLYEMVTGRPPFLGDDDIAIIGQHINTAPVAPAWHNGDCPRPLEALIMRLLSKDPSERPDSAQDVYNALDAIDLTARGESVEQDATSLESLAGGVFVGRQTEMDQLKAALEDVLGGRGRLVTLVGEPGIGKTRTSEELATYAGLRGAQVLWGRCYETGGQPPYWPWVQAIRSYVREIEPDELRRQMGSSASVVAELVTDVKDRLTELQPPPQLDDPDSARFRLFDSITSFLKSASQSQPLVLILDDLHWSDGPSLTFLEFIAREIGQSRLLVVGTYRDMELNRRHPLTVTLGDLNRERLYERVLLRGLTRQDIARFIEIAAGVQAPQELSATVHRHTEGNPLFVTEVVRDLVQSGELAENQESGTSTWSVRIPEGVREVIGRRLDRLSERANDVLTVAAVVGRDFKLDAMKELSEDTSESQLLDVLDEALDARIIEELSDEIGHYQFTHALMQETLTSELSLTRRVRLHARIAETLERLYGDEADEHAAQIVQHFDQAQTLLGTDRLVHYSSIAGQRALASAAYEDAVAHFDRAIAAREGDVIDDELAELKASAGLARGALRQIEASLADIHAAFQYFDKTAQHQRAIEVALTPFVPGALLEGMVPLQERALELVEPESLDQARLFTMWARPKGMSEDHLDQVYERLDTAIAIARKNGDARLELRAHENSIRANAFNSDDIEIRRAHFERAMELIEPANDPLTESGVRYMMAGFLRGQGEMRKATVMIDQAITAANRSGDRERVSSVNGIGANLVASQGDWERTEAYLSEGARAWPDDPRNLGLVAFSEYAQGHDSEDREKLAHMERLMSTVGKEDVLTSPSHPAVCLAAVLPWIYRYTGHHDLLDLMERCGQLIIGRRSARAFRINALRCLLLVARSHDDSEAVSDMYGQLVGLLATHQGMLGGAFSVGLGAEAADARAYEDAASEFDKWSSILRQSHSPTRLSVILSDYAEMLLDCDAPGDREKAIELQDEALTIARDLGMRPLTERILARREILRA